MADGTYATTDFYLAVSLHASGMALADIAPDKERGSRPGRYKFIFVDLPYRAQRVASFLSKADSYPVKTIATSIRELKSRLYTTIDEDSQS